LAAGPLQHLEDPSYVGYRELCSAIDHFDADRYDDAAAVASEATPRVQAARAEAIAAMPLAHRAQARQLRQQAEAATTAAEHRRTVDAYAARRRDQ
jgi:hypothetical protein